VWVEEAQPHHRRRRRPAEMNVTTSPQQPRRERSPERFQHAHEYVQKAAENAKALEEHCVAMQELMYKRVKKARKLIEEDRYEVEEISEMENLIERHLQGGHRKLTNDEAETLRQHKLFLRHLHEAQTFASGWLGLWKGKGMKRGGRRDKGKGEAGWGALIVSRETGARINVIEGPMILLLQLVALLAHTVIFILQASLYVDGRIAVEALLECELALASINTTSEDSLFAVNLTADELPVACTHRELSLFAWLLLPYSLSFVLLLAGAASILPFNLNRKVLRKIVRSPRVLILVFELGLRSYVAFSLQSDPVSEQLRSMWIGGANIGAARIIGAAWFLCAFPFFIVMDALVQTAPRTRILLGLTLLIVLFQVSPNRTWLLSQQCLTHQFSHPLRRGSGFVSATCGRRKLNLSVPLKQSTTSGS
jgi:hypothetical protein